MDPPRCYSDFVLGKWFPACVEFCAQGLPEDGNCHSYAEFCWRRQYLLDRAMDIVRVATES
eukprot:6451741-Karenia_brevis.AAC.1